MKHYIYHYTKRIFFVLALALLYVINTQWYATSSQIFVGQTTVANNHTQHTGQFHKKPLQKIPRYTTSYHSSLIKEYQQQCPDCAIHPLTHFIGVAIRIDHLLYVGSNDHTQQPQRFLDTMKTLGTLAPQRHYPPIFTQILGPASQQTIDLGEQAIQQQCDQQKIKAIESLTRQEAYTIKNNEESDGFTSLLNPCQDYRLPYFLAFNYYEYVEDIPRATQYFLLAALHDDAPQAALFMPATIASTRGNHKQSSLMWFYHYEWAKQTQQAVALQQRFFEKSFNEYKLWKSQLKSEVEYGKNN